MHGAAPRRRHGRLGVFPSQLGRTGGARENLSMCIHERDARIAVRRGHAIELGDDLAADVHAAAAVQHERANGGRGGEDVGVGAAPLEPVGDETRSAFCDGGDTSLPLGEGGLPLALDLEPDEGGNERGAEEEGREIAPREVLSCRCAGRTREARRGARGAGRTRQVVATFHAKRSNEVTRLRSPRMLHDSAGSGYESLAG